MTTEYVATGRFGHFGYNCEMEVSSLGRVLTVEPATGPATIADGLGAAGFEVRRAAKELAALALASKEPFDVVVVDTNLPGMDGMSLVSRLRERAPGTAVVVVTAKYTNELAAEAAEAGVFQMLERSADSKSLARVVRAAVFETRHLLSTLRALVQPATPPRTVPATDAKNEFGSILESAVQTGPVVITKHEAPKAILVSVERLIALLAKHEPNLQALSSEFDGLVARMRTQNSRIAARSLFTAAAEELGEAALTGAQRQDAR
jgi:antitoxin Phd